MQNKQHYALSDRDIQTSQQEAGGASDLLIQSGLQAGGAEECPWTDSRSKAEACCDPYNKGVKKQGSLYRCASRAMDSGTGDWD
ncbi:MAG: hypothetical protein R3E79_51230 [Caldilineaceae bacterium]